MDSSDDGSGLKLMGVWSEADDETGVDRDTLPTRSKASPHRGAKSAMMGALWLASVAGACVLGRLSAPGAATSRTTVANVGSSVIGASEERNNGLHELYGAHIVKAKHVDLTHAYSPTIPVWPGFGPATFGPAVAGQDIDGFIKKGDEFTYKDHGFQATRYTITTDQLGTQLDPPAHWNELGATISDLPATFTLRPLVVIDVHDKVAEDAGYHADVSDVKAWEDKHGRVPKGSVVMIRSDWYKGWEEFIDKGLPAKFPGVTLDALKFLHNEREILFHGHEPLDTDMTPSLEGEAWLMHKDFAQAEGVANLDLVPETGCLVSIGYAKPLGGIGGYARFVAICPEDAPHGVSVEEVSGAPLPKQDHPLRRDENGVMRPTKGAERTKYCDAKSSLGCNDGKPVWAD